MLAHTRICISQPPQDKEDMISKFSDEILARIVSFLPTKEAICTGTLSKRWESIWTFISTLELNAARNFRNDAYGSETFYKFVEKALVDRKMPFLQNVSIKGTSIHRDLTSWISVFKERNMCVLDLSFPSYVRCIPEFPQNLISGCKLVQLRLNMTTIIDFPDAATSCFPNLNLLHLTFIEFVDDDSATNLIKSCPVLEDFKICTYKQECFTTLNVTSRSLKKFMLDYHVYNPNIDDMPKIFINAPAMECIHISDGAPHMYEMNEFPNLDKATILVDGNKSPFSAEYCAMSILELLKHMSNVKSLTITTCTMEALGGCDYHSLPIFCNLTSLDFSNYVNTYWEWKLLMAFLKNCPILEVLIFKGFVFKGGDSNCWLDVPECLISHLKTIKIRVLQKQYQVGKIRYFLDNSQVLEKLIIEDASAFEILTFPMASPSCQIEIH